MGGSRGNTNGRPVVPSQNPYQTLYPSSKSTSSVLEPSRLAGLMQQRPTMNMPDAPMMPQNPYARAAWLRNTPTAHGKLKLF